MCFFVSFTPNNDAWTGAGQCVSYSKRKKNVAKIRFQTYFQLEIMNDSLSLSFSKRHFHYFDKNKTCIINDQLVNKGYMHDNIPNVL